MKLKRTGHAPRREARVARREVEWTTRYRLEGGSDQQWREARVFDVSRGGVGVELLDATSDEIRGHRVLLEFEIPPTVLRLHGEVRHCRPGDEGGLRVGLQFTGLSVLERDLLDSLLDRDSKLPMQRRTTKP